MPDSVILLIPLTIVVFAIGIVVGWQLSTKENVFTEDNLQIAVGILVTLVWVSSIAAEIIIPSYNVSVLIHGIMGAVVGYLFSEKGLNLNLGGTEK